MCYPLSCFSLGSFAGPPGKHDYLENYNAGIPANRAGSVVTTEPSHIVAKLVFVAFNQGAGMQSKPARLMYSGPDRKKKLMQ